MTTSTLIQKMRDCAIKCACCDLSLIKITDKCRSIFHHNTAEDKSASVLHADLSRSICVILCSTDPFETLDSEYQTRAFCLSSCTATQFEISVSSHAGGFYRKRSSFCSLMDSLNQCF